MEISRFREELKKFDPRLDLVWNGVKSRWEIVGVDRKNKRYLIYAIPLGKIDQLGVHILESLYSLTPHRQGGAREVIRRLEEEDERYEKQVQSWQQSVIDAAASEAAESFFRRIGCRINNAGVPYTVNDRRRIHLDPTERIQPQEVENGHTPSRLLKTGPAGGGLPKQP